MLSWFMKPDASSVAAILRELGARIELEGGNAYRAKAYLRAAENLRLSPWPLQRLVEEHRLKEVPGIGDAIAAIITDIYNVGGSQRLEEKRKEIPSSVLEMLHIPGIRAERVRSLFTEHGISSVAKLEEAARSGRLETLKGYGPAFQAKVLEGIEIMRDPPRLHVHRAAAAMAETLAQLARTHPDWEDIESAGALRRGCELVGELRAVAVSPDLRGADEVSTQGEITIRLTVRDRLGAALLHETGSEAHLGTLADLAQEKGLILDERGLRRGHRIVARETEEQIYAALGLPFIAPELRETGSEVELARAGKLPELVSHDDLYGVIHAHTEQSDGVDTLEAMAEAARERGYSYLGLTDHSQTAHYAGGLKPDEVPIQQQAVDQLNRNFASSFHIFKGIESDILADGSLDYPEEILETFDLIVASVHSKFRLSREEQTERIVKAVRNPYTTILGHVTGRQLLRRSGYEVDMEVILEACAEHGVAVEINSHPWRLDLDWRWCARALELGCMFSINSDAHSTDEIDNVRWGILMARKGGVPKNRVLNALPLQEFEAYLAARRRKMPQEIRRRKPRSRRPKKRPA